MPVSEGKEEDKEEKEFSKKRGVRVVCVECGFYLLAL